MFGFRTLLSITIWIFVIQTLQAQHCNAWFRTTLSCPVNKRIKVDAEFQHRRQNGFGNSDLFDKNLMFSFRNWIHYQHSAAIKLSVSPFAYFSNYTIIQKQSEETAKPSSEIRFSAVTELQHLIFKKLYIVSRTAIEYRYFESISNIVRNRNRFDFQYYSTNKLRVNIFDELLLNLIGTKNNHLFDQNRIGIGLEYKVMPTLKFDMGYIHIVRLHVTSGIKLHEDNLFLNMSFMLHKCTKKTVSS